MCESMSSCLHYGWKRVNQLSIHDLNYWHTLWSVIFTFFNIDDPDGYDGIAFSRYLADLKRTGKYIDWEEMI